MTSRVTNKELEGLVAMIISESDKRGYRLFGRRYPMRTLRVQNGPGGSRLIINHREHSGIYEITIFMPKRELKQYLIGLWNGMNIA